MHDQWYSAAGASLRHLYQCISRCLQIEVKSRQSLPVRSGTCKCSGIYKIAATRRSKDDDFNG